MREKSKTILKSDKYKFIFIHNYKVAGTSMRKALCKFEEDWYWLLSNFLYLLPLLRNKTLFTLPKHSDLETVSQFYNLNDYFIFGLVRNPWDWEVSKYFYMRQTPKHYQYELINSFQNFKEYIKWRGNELEDGSSTVWNQLDFFSVDGEIKADYLCKIENIDRIAGKLKEHFGFEISIPTSNKSDHKEYRQYYDNESINIIKKLYRRDIQYFNYSY